MIDLGQFAGFARHVRNPIPAYLDWARLRKSPYRVQTHDGFDLRLRCNGGDRYAFYENLIRRDYLSGGQELGLGDTVIDIGANIGCFTVLASRAVGPVGRVVAAEPDPATYPFLEENVGRNSPSGHVALRRVAVGGHSGTARLISSATALFSSIYQRVDSRQVDGDVVEVELVTIDQLMDGAGIDRCRLLKLDCEGAEYEILETMTPEVAGRIDQVTMEVHQVEGRSFPELTGHLQRLGYAVVSHSDRPLYARRKDGP
jgi:FkbM family methyltransferase